MGPCAPTDIIQPKRGKRMRLSRLTAFLLTVPLLAGCASLPAGYASSAPAPAAAQPPVAPAPTPAPAPAPTPTPTPTTAPITDQSLQNLKAQLEAYLADQQGTYGVYVIDIASGKGVGVNSDMAFPAASTFKLPMAMYVLDQAETGHLSLDDQITYTAEADYEDGTGVLQDSIQEGEGVPIRRLIELAITESDNIATNMILRRIGRDNVFAFMTKLGGKVTTYADTAGTTPRDMANYMRLARTNKVVTDPTLRKFLLDLLSHTAFTDRAAAGVPDGVKVAHKIGTLPGVINDVALVYAPKRTFVVAAFSIDVDDAVAPDVIAAVTRQVYDVERSLAAAQ
ncbi:MAG: putative beta-lactamase [Firmicutes bacterium]|nr:putative beta-lactamase [Bacillota bacterium]